jgi:hypothetical protein
MFSMVILVVIGMAAASLPIELRNKAIAYGIAAAILFRIPLAALTYYLLDIPGLMLIGGCLLFYVCYQLWLDLFKGVDLTPEQLQDGGEGSDSPESDEGTEIMSRRFLNVDFRPCAFNRLDGDGRDPGREDSQQAFVSWLYRPRRYRLGCRQFGVGRHI